jgi:hypothetical protein
VVYNRAVHADEVASARFNIDCSFQSARSRLPLSGQKSAGYGQRGVTAAVGERCCVQKEAAILPGLQNRRQLIPINPVANGVPVRNGR